jgi:outer membrane protein TolC
MSNLNTAAVALTFAGSLAILSLSSCSGATTITSDISAATEGEYASGNLQDIGIKSKSTRSNRSNPDQTNTLSNYIRHALHNSAELKAAFDSYQASLQRSPQVRALPDPKINYGYFIQSAETRVGPQRHRLGVSQSFPWFGTLSLREEQSQAEARAKLYRFFSLKNELVFQVTRNYSELAYLLSASTIMEDRFKLVKSWEDVLRERFRSNVGSHSDLIRVQVEMGKLEDRISEIRELVPPTRISFNSLLNRPGAEPIAGSSDVFSELWVNDTAASAYKITDDVILQSNPELLMHTAFVEANSQGVMLAKKKYYPDISAGLDYIATGEREGASDSGKDTVVSAISLNLPLDWGKFDAGLKEAELNKQSIEATREAKQYSLLAELAHAKFALSDSERRIVLYKNTLIPKAEESMQTSFTAYQNGSAAFLDVLDIERQLLDFELSLIRAQADRLIAAATLLKLSGGYSELSSYDKEN